MHRRSSTHLGTSPHMSRHAANSSAFSASANPDEDWTKITDLAERRRIQNRIAQRNYRKKLKRRLEDLEKRATSSSPGPEDHRGSDGRSQSPQASDSRPRRTPGASPARQLSETSSTSEIYHQQQYLPVQDERGMFSHQYTRQLSTSPPPFSYGAYSQADPQSFAPFTQQSQYQIPMATADATYYNSYLSPPVSTTGSQFYSVPDASKREPFSEDSSSNPFSNMVCPSMRAPMNMDMGASQAYPQQILDPHVMHPNRYPSRTLPPQHPP